jgi:hypothetical protein
MTRDDVIRIAATIWNAGSFFPIPSSDDLERFAALVAAAEREACAKVCEPQEQHDDPLTAHRIAAAIRARGEPGL